MPLLTKLFGDANKKFLRQLSHAVGLINSLEPDISKLSTEELQQKTKGFKSSLQHAYQQQQPDIDKIEERIALTADDAERNELKVQLRKLKDQPLNTILPEAFAVVREAAKRTLTQRHFDVQLMGGMVLHDAQVAEMRTGEGKTLTSTLAVYLNALTGRGVHVITVNDYLAKRDAVWMGQIYHLLGLRIGVIVHETSYLYDPAVTSEDDDRIRDAGVKVTMDFLREVSRRQAYDADITYGTNNEFGFDYLRDNMVLSLHDKVQRELHYAIVDEVDSILIDEARTPLIISAPDTRPTERYYQFARLVETLKKDTEYSVDEKLKTATLTEQGIIKVEKALGVENLYVEEGIQTIHHIEQALKAKTLFSRDKDYTVKDGQVIIVDEFTGRLLHGRRYSEGLHQAIEAKEGLQIQRESRTMATITFQNYFRLYSKLAGMTGTAATEAEELGKIYNLEVTSIPTHKPMIRADLQDRVYKNHVAKFRAVVHEVKERHQKGQPLLIGTISIEKNEFLGSLLEQEGLPFNILNAKHHEREAEIIAQAGSIGAITLATNMAGRGVDIKLGGQSGSEEEYKKVVALGGLHVLGTERHESRRIDNQLRGRSGRQGDPGSSQFYVSIEDDLMRIFGADRVKLIMKNWPEDMPIENRIVSKSIESAQKKVEGHNFDIRKHLVEFDDVANKQRMYIYRKRDQILEDAAHDNEKIFEISQNEIIEEIEDIINLYTQTPKKNEWDIKRILSLLQILISPSEQDTYHFRNIIAGSESPDVSRQKTSDIAISKAKEKFNFIIEQLNKKLTTVEHSNPAKEIIKTLYLRSIDLLWVEHLETLQYLRTGIGLRGYGQRDPVVEYKRESHHLFNDLLAGIRRQLAYSFMNINAGAITPITETKSQQLQEQKSTVHAFSGSEKNNRSQTVTSKVRYRDGSKIGRNDPCPCGATKSDGTPIKYKHCHGKNL